MCSSRERGDQTSSKIRNCVSFTEISLNSQIQCVGESVVWDGSAGWEQYVQVDNKCAVCIECSGVEWWKCEHCEKWYNAQWYGLWSISQWYETGWNSLTFSYRWNRCQSLRAFQQRALIASVRLWCFQHFQRFQCFHNFVQNVYGSINYGANYVRI